MSVGWNILYEILLGLVVLFRDTDMNDKLIHDIRPLTLARAFQITSLPSTPTVYIYIYICVLLSTMLSGEIEMERVEIDCV